MVTASTETALTRYDAACRAIARARSTDEVRKIRSEATAMRAYAKQAKNRQLELDAAEIRIRAERRIGELMKAQDATVGLNKGTRGAGRPKLGGVKRTPPNTVPSLADVGIDHNLAARSRKLAAIPAPQFEQRVTEWRAGVESNGDRVTTSLGAPGRASVHHTSDTAEHYTPREVLDAVIECMGAIDLDPCSNTGKPNVPALRRYTQHDDGLAQSWAGRVFMNPPYGREVGMWIRKLRAEWDAGHLAAAIALLPARTDTEWFEDLTTASDDVLVCLWRGRLTFIGNADPAPFPSMVVYFGPRHDEFARVFGELGSLWCRPSRPAEWFMDHT